MATLAVLHQGEGYIAIDKPPGALVIPGRGEPRGPSLREQLESELKRRVYVVHRLDRDTTGVLLFALDSETHRALSMAFEAGRVEKHYLALVQGRLEEAVSIDTPLSPARRGRMRPARPGEGGKAALTLVRPLELFENATLVDAQPLTGRTHQIRVHLASVGHALCVDPQYGAPAAFPGGAGAPVLTRTPLHASRLELPALGRLSPRRLESPLPEDMRRVLELLRGRGARG